MQSILAAHWSWIINNCVAWNNCVEDSIQISDSGKRGHRGKGSDSGKRGHCGKGSDSGKRGDRGSGKISDCWTICGGCGLESSWGLEASRERDNCV